MHKSKLLELLGYIQPEEIRSFLKLLRSPFYASNGLPEQLFLYIYKYHPSYTSPHLTKEKAFQHIFPKAKYNPHKMRKLMSELKGLTETYLINAEIRKEDWQRKQLLLNAYKARNMYSHFQKMTLEMLEELEALPHRDLPFYRNKYGLQTGLYEHPQTDKANVYSVLESAIDHLDYYYLLQRQRMVFAQTSFQRLLDAKAPPKQLEENIRALQSIPLFQIYELIQHLQAKPTDLDRYDAVETFFKKEIDQFAQNDQKEIIRILINHLSHLLNKGQKELSKKILSLYQFGLDKAIFLDNQQIKISSFSNIVSTGILEEQFEWVASFIDQYGQHLPIEDREDTICLNRSLLLLYQKKYNRAIELLQAYRFSNIFLNLKARGILIRASFELFIEDNTYFELLIAQVEAFEKYLRRKERITEAKKTTFFNFLSFVKKIAYRHLEENLDHQLYDQVEQHQSIVLKNWLLKQLHLLLSQKKEQY